MSRRRYLQLVLVLGSLTALGPLTIDMYLPALPSLTADLATTEAAAQATITGMLVGLGLGQLVIGPLSDALGRRRPLHHRGRRAPLSRRCSARWRPASACPPPPG